MSDELVYLFMQFIEQDKETKREEPVQEERRRGP